MCGSASSAGIGVRGSMMSRGAIEPVLHDCLGASSTSACTRTSVVVSCRRRRISTSPAFPSGSSRLRHPSVPPPPAPHYPTILGGGARILRMRISNISKTRELAKILRTRNTT